MTDRPTGRPTQLPHTNGRFSHVGFGVPVLILGSKNGSFQWGLAKIGVSKWQFAMGFGSKNDRCAASPRHLPSNAERYLLSVELFLILRFLSLKYFISPSFLILHSTALLFITGVKEI